MTRWTIDGRGDTGTKAIHFNTSGRHTYNVQRLPSGFWLAEVDYPDGSRHRIDASEMTEAGSHARCEFHAANLRSEGVSS
jgi:hypothetical protein